MNARHFRATAGWLAAFCVLSSPGAGQAQSGPEFGTLTPLTNHDVQLTLSAPTGACCRLDASTDLSSWIALATLSTNAGALHYIDSAAPFLDRRFYRAEQLAGTNQLTGDHLVTSAGDVIIHPVYHASLILGWGGLTICVDPGDTASRFAGLPRADLVLLTHGHSDHYVAGVVTAVKGSNAVLVAPSAVYATMPSALKGATVVLTNGATTYLLGLKIDAVPAYNLTSTQHPQGQGNGYVLTFGDRRLYVSGDTEDTPELRALRDIDVAFLCMNLPYTMTVAKALSAVREFRPRVVYPYHYRDQSGALTNAVAFKQQLGTDLGIEIRLRKWY
jgi:L-ascorbate metabolism protein UlaG (beta-lactamase superfamily)